MTTYVAHMPAEERATSPTRCAAPWQPWQAPAGWRGPVTGPERHPQVGDEVRPCRRCPLDGRRRR